VLRRLSSRTLLSLQTREIRLERRAEPAGTREVRLQTSWTCWNERGSSRLAWSLVVTWEVADDTRVDWWWHERPFDDTEVRPVAWGDRGLVPDRPSTRWTLGRVDSRFVWEFVYRVACQRDRRPTSLKDILEAYNCFYYSFVFVISVIILIL